MWHCQVEFPFRIEAAEQRSVEDILPDGLFEITDVRCPLKTLHLNGNLLIVFLRSNHPFRAKIDKDISLPKCDGIGIVRDGPAITDEGCFHLFVVNVFSWNCLTRFEN